MDADDYLLGSNSDELSRLREQHRLWQPAMEEAFANAGFGPGQIILDLGAGPGFATADLARLVGREGKVVAVEKSPAYVDALGTLDYPNIEVRHADLANVDLDRDVADGAYLRWVLTFMSDPARVVRDVADALRPGGALLILDFLDYGAWEAFPFSEDLARLRDLIIRACLDAGGAGPRVAAMLPDACSDAGLEILSNETIAATVARGDWRWRWLELVLRNHPRRLHQLGYCSAREAAEFASLPDRLPPDARMRIPTMAQVIARKP